MTVLHSRVTVASFPVIVTIQEVTPQQFVTAPSPARVLVHQTGHQLHTTVPVFGSDLGLIPFHVFLTVKWHRIAFFASQRVLTYHKNMSDDSQTEPVALGIVRPTLRLTVIHLRGHVGQSSTFLKLALSLQVESHAVVDDGRFRGV